MLITSVHVDSAPEPRRAAAGALFTTTNTTSKQLLIHGGRLAAGHILGDLWQAQLGAGNISYQQLWPTQQQAVQKKKGKKGKKPFGPAARKGHAAVAVEDPDACLVSVLSLSSCVGGCMCCDEDVLRSTNQSTNLQSCNHMQATATNPSGRKQAQCTLRVFPSAKNTNQ